MTRREQRIIILIFCVIIALPLALYLTGIRGENIENRRTHRMPRISAEAILSAEWFRKFDLYAQDKLPLREYFIGYYNLVGWYLLKDTNSRAVTRGFDDWLFHNDGLLQPCVSRDEIKTHIMQLVQIAKVSQARWNTRVVWVIAPDKEAIYPEKLKPHQKALAHCSFANREAVRTLIREDGIAPYILGLWDALEEEKPRHPKPLYQQYDTHWNPHGAAYGGARAITNHLQPDLWNAESISFTRTRMIEPDLLKLLGITHLREAEHLLTTSRTGIHVEDVSKKQKLCVSANVKRRQTFLISAQPDASARIMGNSVFIHDSFIYNLYEHLLPYMENVELGHFEEFWRTYTDQLTECADTLIYQTVERNFIKRAKNVIEHYQRLEAYRP